jgi:hypothetical protein
MRPGRFHRPAPLRTPFGRRRASPRCASRRVGLYGQAWRHAVEDRPANKPETSASSRCWSHCSAATRTRSTSAHEPAAHRADRHRAANRPDRGSTAKRGDAGRQVQAADWRAIATAPLLRRSRCHRSKAISERQDHDSGRDRRAQRSRARISCASRAKRAGALLRDGAGRDRWGKGRERSTMSPTSRRRCAICSARLSSESDDVVAGQRRSRQGQAPATPAEAPKVAASTPAATAPTPRADTGAGRGRAACCADRCRTDEAAPTPATPPPGPRRRTPAGNQGARSQG